MTGKRKRGRPKTWKQQVEEETEKSGLKEDALNRSGRNCRRNGVNPAISAKGTIPDKN